MSGTLDSNLLVPSLVDMMPSTPGFFKGPDMETDRPMALATVNTGPGNNVSYGGAEPFDDDLTVDLLAGLESGVLLGI